MTLDDLDIEIEDDDGTGVRNGTVRYPDGMFQFSIMDNIDVIFLGKLPPFMMEYKDEVEKIILEIAK